METVIEGDDDGFWRKLTLTESRQSLIQSQNGATEPGYDLKAPAKKLGRDKQIALTVFVLPGQGVITQGPQTILPPVAPFHGAQNPATPGDP